LDLDDLAMLLRELTRKFQRNYRMPG